jgi:transposase
MVVGQTLRPRDLPERHGPWQTVAAGFYRWTKQGIWDKLLADPT